MLWEVFTPVIGQSVLILLPASAFHHTAGSLVLLHLSLSVRF